MTTELLMQARDLTKTFSSGGGKVVQAVRGVDIDIPRGTVLGLVGESGSGKSTVGYMLSHLERPTSGSITFGGDDVTTPSRSRLKQFRREVQIVFQDPAEALNPRYTIQRALAEPLRVQGIASRRTVTAEVRKALEAVDLTPPGRFMRAFPHQVSGGQRQRVALARAIATRPKLVIADEPVSMLDVSVRAEVLNLMLRLKRDFDMTYLFITHDLAVARYMCDRIAVMYLGRIVEEGPANAILERPRHPYSQLLLSAVPEPDPTAGRVRAPIRDGSMREPASDQGCQFRTRCPAAMAVCQSIAPQLVAVGDEHRASCHLYTQPDQAMARSPTT